MIIERRKLPLKMDCNDKEQCKTYGRKAECLFILKGMCPKVTEALKNPLLVGASRAIDLKYSDNFGQYIVAAKYIAASEILRVCRSFCLSIHPQSFSSQEVFINLISKRC